MVPSTSMNASFKNPSGCTFHTLGRARLRNWRRVRIAHNAKHAKQFFTVTHPFHPWRGRRFELINCECRWGQWRVFYVNEEGSLAYLPASWTDASAKDPFVEQARGRAVARLEDLLKLAELVSGKRK